MHVKLDTLAVLVDRIPALRLDSLRQFGRKFLRERQRFLVSLLALSFAGQRAHAAEPWSTALDRSYLLDGLRVSRSGYKALIGTLYKFCGGNSGYDRDRRLSKAYQLRPEIRRAYEELLSSQTFPVIWEDDNGDQCPPPTSGVPPGVPLQLPAVVPLSTDAVDRALLTVERWIAGAKEQDEDGAHWPLTHGRPFTLDAARCLLLECRAWCRSLGGLPSLYVEQSNGRLGPACTPHVIQLPQRLRSLLFCDSGWYDYDLDSSHWRSFASLASAYSIRTDRVREYVDNKAALHERWAEQAGIRHTGLLKPVVLSFLTGGSLAATSYTESGRSIGVDAMRRLAAVPELIALREEANAGMRRVVDLLKTPDGQVTSAIGKTIDAGSFAVAAAHVLTGAEQFAVRTMATEAKPVALIYDGMVARQVDTARLERLVAERSTEALGFPLHVRLRERCFTAPECYR